MGYTKLFGSIVASTIWREDMPTKVVWITMLALKNERHIVEGSVPGLAHLAGVSVEECRAALAKFMGPDADSRNQDHDGRRIVQCDGGWMILNGEYYREKMNMDDRREYNRIAQKNRRAKLKGKRKKKVSAPSVREREFVKASENGDTTEQDRLTGTARDVPEPPV